MVSLARREELLREPLAADVQRDEKILWSLNKIFDANILRGGIVNQQFREIR